LQPPLGDTIQRVTKRTVSVNVKLSPEDWQLLVDAANHIWPEAPISRAGIVAGLAKLGAKGALAGKEPSPRKAAKKS
jgi:hypothetical protein